MDKAYLIVDPGIKLSDIVLKIYNYRWRWDDESEETDQEPYTRVYFDIETESHIYYREEHKDVFESRYFYVEGDDIKPVVKQLQDGVPLLSTDDLIAGFDKAGAPLKRGSCLYQLGIAVTDRPFSASIRDAFKKGLQDDSADVRIATLWGMAWPHWAELRPLVEQATKDSDAAVSKTAKTLLEAFEKAD